MQDPRIEMFIWQQGREWMQFHEHAMKCRSVIRTIKASIRTILTHKEPICRLATATALFGGSSSTVMAMQQQQHHVTSFQTTAFLAIKQQIQVPFSGHACHAHILYCINQQANYYYFCWQDPSAPTLSSTCAQAIHWPWSSSRSRTRNGEGDVVVSLL